MLEKDPEARPTAEEILNRDLIKMAQKSDGEVKLVVEGREKVEETSRNLFRLT
jgi:hypothetical protein